jgi:hypothetical protein
VKLLFFLLSFYILLLPCLPCNDNESCSNKATTTITQSKQNKEQHHENEACSPFCSCACCGQIFLSTAPIVSFSVSNNFNIVNEQYFYTSVSIPFNFFGNIWQPPKYIV